MDLCTGSLGEFGVARSAAEAHEAGGGASRAGASDKTKDENLLEHFDRWGLGSVWAQTAWERVWLRIRCANQPASILTYSSGVCKRLKGTRFPEERLNGGKGEFF